MSPLFRRQPQPTPSSSRPRGARSVRHDPRRDREHRDRRRQDPARLRRGSARDTDWHFEYSPETVSTAELDFSVEVCAAVMDVLQPTRERPIVFNLPATVACATPNIYADQIEWFGRNIPNREAVVISLHTHNDRGTSNCNFVTVALNMYTQGVDPGLDFSDIDEIVNTVQYCTNIPVHPYTPYRRRPRVAALFGSHQDAIKKGFAAQDTRNDELWEVPYLPIDPANLSRSYEVVIRVNSQSGKGGVT